ncbi:hypothetical protein NUK34_08050 [Kerstersia gyiorum]|uniref:hypothetical protein n=1 Tax=Kerstersia gyiorum TaxID=206506 RepID=UPI00214FF6C9|nr:hypothetical protein [Kerstersia gyiorum]MCR4158803.1 hypothetical protein [Kerstersia gyiorum]
MTDQNPSDLDRELKIAVARIALLEATVAGLVQVTLPAEVKKDFISRLSIIKNDLLDMGIPSFDNSVLDTLRRGPSPDGPGASIQK